jgi:hypothetical protein
MHKARRKQGIAGEEAAGDEGAKRNAQIAIIIHT